MAREDRLEYALIEAESRLQAAVVALHEAANALPDMGKRPDGQGFNPTAVVYGVAYNLLDLVNFLQDANACDEAEEVQND